jgi:prepilin-type N-terminal cleavage/methylation domain-containing protein
MTLKGRPRRTDERGFTIAEMTVTTLILGVLSAAAMTVTNSFLSNSDRATQRFTNVGEAQTVMDALTRDLRAATIIVSPVSPTAVTFYATLGGPSGAELLTFNLTGSTLTQATSLSPPYNTSTSATLGAHVAGSSGVLFTYYDVNGNPTTTVGLICKIGISLVDNVSGYPDSAATLKSFVWPRNLIYGGCST